MISDIEKYRVEGLNGMERIDFGVDEADIGGLMTLLGEKLYTDKPLAVVREYITNSFDANIEAGNREKSVIITIPTLEEPFFRVRDLGKGLNREEIEKIYVKYGKSTKRQSNDQSGMMGIGCKSAFAYSDSFNITSWKDGICSRYTCQKTETNRPTCLPLSSEPSTEPNGIEIEVAVSPHDVKIFRKKILFVSQFLAIKPILKNCDESFEIEKIMEGDHFFIANQEKFLGNTSSYGSSTYAPYAIMGGIAYPLGEFSGDFTEEEKIKTVSNRIIFLKFDMGEISFPPSREMVEYNPKTVTAIKNKLKLMKNEVTKTIQTKIDAIPNILEAIDFIETEIYNSGSLASFKLKLTDFNHRGQKFGHNVMKLSSEFFQSGIIGRYNVSEDFRKETNYGGYRRRRRWSQPTYEAQKINTNCMVVINDNAQKFWKEALRQNMSSLKKGCKIVYMVDKSHADYDKLMTSFKDHFIDQIGDYSINVSSLTFNIARVARAASGVASYKGQAMKFTSSANKLPYFHKTDLEEAPDDFINNNTQKIYMRIKNFNILNSESFSLKSYAYELKILEKQLKALNVDQNKIVFIRSTNVKSLPTDWVDAFEYVKTEGKKRLDNLINKFGNILVNVYLNNAQNIVVGNVTVTDNIIEASNCPELKELSVFSKKCNVLKEKANEFGNLVSTFDLQSHIPTVENNIVKLKEAVLLKYPLMNYLNYTLDSKAESCMIEYVKLIDQKNETKVVS